MIRVETLAEVYYRARRRYGVVRLEVQTQGDGELLTEAQSSANEWDGSLELWRHAKRHVRPGVPFSVATSTAGDEGELQDVEWHVWEPSE